MHIPVLLQESVNNLALGSGATLVDGTLGSGGHSAYALETCPGLTLIGLDKDPKAIERSREVLRNFSSQTKFVNDSFRNIDIVLAELGISQVDAVLLDIGVSSDQIDNSGRGFTFQHDEPLLMTMSGSEEGLTAKEILNTWDEETIELILRGFGEEKYSRRIAREIVTRRETDPFETTFDLLEAIHAAVPASAKRFKINPATRTFQALRIAVNEELTALEEGLAKSFSVLKPGGRLAVISFHSLEDRIVKNYFRELSQADEGKLITKKPIVPSETETQDNSRSRSAKLRVIEKM